MKKHDTIEKVGKVAGNVFNLYMLKTGSSIYKNKEHELVDIKTIDDFDFSNFFVGRKNPHDICSGAQNIHQDVTFQFYTIKEPLKPVSWRNLYKRITGKECDFTSMSYSYVLFIFYNGEKGRYLFAVTGGNGFNIIKNQIDSSFPFTLINKLVEDTGVFGYVKQNNLIGHEIYTERGFVSEYDVLAETNYWTLNKEANIKIPKEKLLELGLDIEKRGRTGIFLAKGFKIIKSLQFENLIKIVTFIAKILKDNDDISNLNGIKHVEDIGIRNNLYLLLFQKLQNTPDSVLFLPDNEKLFFSCDERIINSLSKQCSMEKASDYFEILKNEDGENYAHYFSGVDFGSEIDKVSEAIKYFGLYDIELKQDDYSEKFKFIESIHTDLLRGGENFIFIHGKFYSLDRKVIELIGSDFQNLLNDYGEDILIDNILPKAWGESMMEEEYLELYKDIENYYILDKFTPENVEFCDLLHLRDGKIYLIHVKTGFGNVSRDHALQAQMSCEKIVHNINNKNKTYFEAVYDNCVERFGDKLKKHFNTRQDFIDKMSNKDDIFVIVLAGYESHGGRLSESKSYIGKVSMLDALRRISHNLGFKIRNIGLFNGVR